MGFIFPTFWSKEHHPKGRKGRRFHEEALEALIAANVEALEEVIGGLQDPENRKWFELGLMALGVYDAELGLRSEDGHTGLASHRSATSHGHGIKAGATTHQSAATAALSDDGQMNLGSQSPYGIMHQEVVDAAVEQFENQLELLSQGALGIPSIMSTDDGGGCVH